MTKIPFRNYEKYPPRFSPAVLFRDAHNEQPDVEFLASAKDEGLYDLLVELGQWEWDNTDFDPSMMESREMAQ